MIGKQKSSNYIAIIRNKVLPIIRLNVKDDFVFQQDNSPIHVSRETLNFFKEANVKLLDWPPYSPDLNIIENVLEMLSSHIYGQGTVRNLKELRSRIDDSVSNFNETKAQEAFKFYKSMPSRLYAILESHGKRIPY